MRMLSHEPSLSVANAVGSLSILSLTTTSARQLLFSIPMVLQAIGSFQRIQDFLQLEQVPISAALSNVSDLSGAELRDIGAELAVGLSAEAHLHEDFYFIPNSFTAITGPIGCGKSTVLMRLIAEASRLSDEIAYCSQTPWVHEGTVRDNIIGESAFDQERYSNVIRSCELDADLGCMPALDSTIVGSRGLRLSGGQRQRIVCNLPNHGPAHSSAHMIYMMLTCLD